MFRRYFIFQYIIFYFILLYFKEFEIFKKLLVVFFICVLCDFYVNCYINGIKVYIIYVLYLRKLLFVCIFFFYKIYICMYKYIQVLIYIGINIYSLIVCFNM